MPAVHLSSIVIVGLLAVAALLVAVTVLAANIRRELDNNFIGTCAREVRPLPAAVPPKGAPMRELAQTLVHHAAMAYTIFCRPPRTKAEWIPQGWTLVAVLSVRSGTDGFVLRSPDAKALVISFRGTYTTSDIGLDFHMAKEAFRDVNPKAVGEAHIGFLRRYLDLRDATLRAINDAQLAAGAQVFVTGHSLGAALAVLAAYDLKLLGVPGVRAVAFAPPKVGSLDMALDVHSVCGSDLLLVENSADMVPTSPPNSGFYHASRNVLVFFADLGSWRANHSVGKAYRAALLSDAAAEDYDLRLLDRPQASPLVRGDEGSGSSSSSSSSSNRGVAV